jgi:phosphohistidine phosphatase
MKASAAAFKKIGLEVDEIISSPLKRAEQTAQIAADALEKHVKLDERLVYGFGMPALQTIIDDYPTAKALMLVGHEPDFSTTISELTGGSDIEMKKGGLARVDLSDSPELRGLLVWLLPPKILITGLSQSS